MKNNRSPLSTPLSKISNAPITPITIVNRSQILNNTKGQQKTITDDLDDDWITVLPSNKRPYTQSPGSSPIAKHSGTASNNIKVLNRYTPLQTSSDNMETEQINEPTPHKPPPIFIKSDINYVNFCEAIKKIIDIDDFTCKSNTSGLKLQIKTPDSYRKIVRVLLQKNVDFHTYQIKQDKPFRVVLKNLHHSTDPNIIKKELTELGFNVKQVVNTLQRYTKKPLPMFFVDLEPDTNNNEIFKVDTIYHSKIKFEELILNNNPIQCLRCQNFGHTKRYCNHEPRPCQNVTELICQMFVKKLKTNLPNVYYVEELIQRITEGAPCTKTNNSEKHPILHFKKAKTFLIIIIQTMYRSPLVTPN